MKKYARKSSHVFGALPPKDGQRTSDASTIDVHNVAAGKWAYKDFETFVQDLKQIKDFSERVTRALQAMHGEFEFFTQVNELILTTYKQQQNNTEHGDPAKPTINPQNLTPKSVNGERRADLRNSDRDSDEEETPTADSPKDFLR